MGVFAFAFACLHLPTLSFLLLINSKSILPLTPLSLSLFSERNSGSHPDTTDVIGGLNVFLFGDIEKASQLDQSKFITLTHY